MGAVAVPLPPAAPAAPARPLLVWLAGRAALAPGVLAGALAAPDPAGANGDEPEWLARALAADDPFTALTLVAAALPPREGVWWAWVAVRHAMQVLAERAATPPVAPTPAEHAALAQVERWIAEPVDANRRAAWAAGEAAGLTTPAGAACAAVFFTSGSIAAPQSPMAVPPPAGAHVLFAAAAVLAASARSDPAHLPDLVAAAAAQAAAVAGRLGGWNAAATLARQHFDAQRAQHAAAVDASTPKGPPAA